MRAKKMSKVGDLVTVTEHARGQYCTIYQVINKHVLAMLHKMKREDTFGFEI